MSNIMASLSSLQVGMPRILQHGSKEVLSGIFKSATNESHYVSRLGVEGDGQGDTEHHGGVDKAVCAYSMIHYSKWSVEFGRTIGNGAFGENFTISGWTEEDICIGDTVSVGEALLQVSQPRQPCYKLGIRNKQPELVMRAQLTGYTGFYFRVLQEGRVQQGDTLTITERDPNRFTIAAANQIMYIDKNNAEAIERLLAVEMLANSWKEQLSKRLAKLKKI